jgi:uncharacterized membrane protein YdjX (TVP38/TMEM64 family)
MSKLKSIISTYRIALLTFAVQGLLMILFHFGILNFLKVWVYENAHDQSLLFWLLFFLAAIPLLSIGVISSTLLAIMVGYYLGWSTILYYFPAYIVASWLGYFIVSNIDKGKTFSNIEQQSGLTKYIDKIRSKPFMTIFLLRTSPIISFGQLTSLCAFLKIPASTYIQASFWGMIPRTLLAIYGGIYLKTMNQNFIQFHLPAEYNVYLYSLSGISLVFVTIITLQKLRTT